MVDYVLSKSNSHGKVRKLDHHTQHLIYADNENNQDTKTAEIIPADKHRMTDIPIPEANSIGYGNFFRNALSAISPSIEQTKNYVRDYLLEDQVQKECF